MGVPVPGIIRKKELTLINLMLKYSSIEVVWPLLPLYILEFACWSMQQQIQPSWLDLVVEPPPSLFFSSLMYNSSDAIFGLVCSFNLDLLSLFPGEDSTCYLLENKGRKKL